MPDTAAIGELRAVSMLYLPEVTPQVERVTKAYRGFMDDLTKTTMPALMKYKPGDPLPTMLSQPVIDELMQSTQALEAKLVEIAKRDRRS
jgi:hypothetical protein